MPINLKVAVKIPRGTSKPAGIFRHYITPLAKAIDREFGALETQFKKSYANWSPESKPFWEKSNPTAAFSAFSATGVLEGEFTTKSTPYVFVSAGVPGWSRATFSKDYRPMTHPGRLSSYPRQGRVIKRGRGAARKRPITARKFDEKVAKSRDKKFGRKIAPIVFRGARKIVAVPGTGGMPGPGRGSATIPLIG